MLVVEVTPSNLPPVRYRGRTFIRIGPRKDLATREEEEILTERRSYNFPTMDNTPCCQATLEDIDQDLFTKYYLPKAVDAGIVSKNNRSVKKWMISLRLYSKVYDCLTNAALLLFGTDPRRFMPGANALKAMLALISRNPQITYDQLAKESNISRETVRRHIGKLRDDYKVISRSGKTRGYWVVIENDN